MKSLAFLAAIMAMFLSVSAQAGETVVSDSKTVAPAPPPPPEVYGTGFYGGVLLGANVYQENRGTRSFTNDAGDTLTIDPKNDPGFFGGIKIGYIFGTGKFRFALEEDMFYNGWSRGADSTVVDVDGVVTRTSSSSININSGAFLTNGILKFGNQRFQPYIGAGAGGYFAETPGIDVNGFQSNGSGNASGFAWQAFAGADYYFNPKTSIFIEYKFLEYLKYDEEFNNSIELNQQLIGAGLRFHF